MSSVKILDKDQLERLSAQIFLQTGKKFTQQELLTLCVQFAHDRLEDFLTRISKGNRIWSEDEIKKLEEEYVTDFGEGSDELSKKVDDIVYGD